MLAENQRKMLLFRAKHRGCKETDHILGRYVMRFIDEFQRDELKTLEKLLEVDDNTFYSWCCYGYDGDDLKIKDMVIRVNEFNQQQFSA